MAELVTLATDAGLAIITLNRPEAGNAMSMDLILTLGNVTERIAADESVRAVVILAEGRNFCVGGDISAFASEKEPDRFISALADALHESVRRLAALEAPVIIGVQGAAAGAGLSLAAGADLVLAGEGASFTMAYTAIGLTGDGGATWYLPRVIGLRRAQELAFTNRRLSAGEALEWGLVTRVVADDVLRDETIALGRRMAAGPTRAYGGVKRLFMAGAGASLGDQLDAEARAIGAAMRTRDAQGAAKAFLERRKIEFEGE